MNSTLFHTPGQTVTIFLETFGDGYTTRHDAPSLPAVDKIIFPNLTLAAGYPKPMTKIATGLYKFSFTLPTTATAVGSYVVDVSWLDPVSSNSHQTFYQVVVTAPLGQYSVTVG